MYTIIAVILVALVVVGSGSAVISAYNRLVFVKNNVGKAFANIDILLKQRADEIPELVKVLKESMRFEESTLSNLTKLRTQYLNAQSSDEKIEAANGMEKQLKTIIATAENYPELKTTANFGLLQTRVSQIEDAIADRREYYNESVNLYNIGIEQFPDIILAKMMGYAEKPMLRVTEQEKNYNGITF